MGLFAASAIISIFGGLLCGGGDGAQSADDLHKAFVVEIEDGCTGTLISKDWVLTASHCFKDIGRPNKPNAHGDVELTKQEFYDYAVKKKDGPQLSADEMWTDEIRLEPPPVDKVDYRWRELERVILHKDFQGEALSWEGGDFALVKLGSVLKPHDSGQLLPACLPSENFPFRATNLGKAYMSGWGRRLISHCMTDEQGPEAFAVCGRPRSCSRQHRTRYCGLDFLYNGTRRNACLEGQTPSAGDPDCLKLYEARPDEANQAGINHIFEDGEYVTTCYPPLPPDNTKGWCTIRDPGISDDEEPAFSSGWGFCSTEKNQDMCNVPTQERKDEIAYELDILDDAYCVTELGKNLEVEQPDVTLAEFQNIPSKGLYCAGRNSSYDFGRDGYFNRDGDGEYEKVDRDWVGVSGGSTLKDKLVSSGNISEFNVNGGPSCFGDSGGPMWRIVENPVTKKKVPVLVGVFSFMLWGVCVGRREPTFYGSVSDVTDWIHKYVNETTTCRSPELI